MAPKQPLERTDTEQMDEANANSHGNVFGGDILRSMDRYASWTAAAYAEEDVVTASITRMSFEEPVDTDDELVYETRVDYVGDTSLTVAVDVKVADTGTATASAYLTYVAQDDDGDTVTVPDLDLDTEDDEDRYEAAEAWKEEAKAHSRGSLPDPDDWDIEGTVTRMRPRHADEKDKVFGGAILSVMDEVASAAAERYAEESVVTASLDTMSFEEPVYTDDLLVMDANVDYVGSSSMVVAVDVHAEDAQEAEIRDTGSAYLTFVAVDDDGPMSVPSLDPDSDEEEERYEAAEAWKEKVLDDLSD
ncbi:MAG: hotdog domain-containing protein [Candidatus Nanohaloarchaea archaeon]|nr:hotdog domain-containing protein [Candidatus Nanohaloarchaea archaeon]